jgi:3'-phosphoadenosine 5'-phosphosulfate sulfotransferase
MKYIKALVVLKTGQKLEISTDEDRRFDAESFTEKTLQKFIKRNQTGAYLVQGSNIAYVETIE